MRARASLRARVWTVALAALSAVPITDASAAEWPAWAQRGPTPGPASEPVTSPVRLGEPSAFRPVEPVRLVDTRTGLGVDRLGPSTLRVRVPRTVLGDLERDHAGGHDRDPSALALSVTLVAPTGFATAYPAGTTRPDTSTVNVSDPTRPATAAALVAAPAGAVDVYASDPAAHVIVDLTGVFVPVTATAAGRLVGSSPVRVLDTRGGAPVRVGDVVRVALPAWVPPDATALAVNVTTIATAAPGHAALHPAGSPSPTVSQVSTGRVGAVRAAASIVGVSADGLDVTVGFAGHLVVDVTGYVTGPSAPIAADGLFRALDRPVRLADTRRGWFWSPGAAHEVAVVGGPVAGVAGTVTMVQPRDAGHLRVHAAGTPIPDTSAVNAEPGAAATANLAVSAVSERGLALWTQGRTHVVVDQTGVFTGRPVAATAPPPVPRPTAAYPAGPCDVAAPGAEPLDVAVADPVRPPVAIGTSVEGRTIWAEYWGPPDPERTVLVVAQVHGDECAAVRVAHAVRRRPAHPRLGYWLVPTLNPDGHARGSRYNARGADLNADGGRWSQPETGALMAFTATFRPALTVHVHSPNGFAGWFGGHPAGSIALEVAAATGMRAAPAGARPDPSRWFLWQGQQRVHAHPAVLVELFAIAPGEVPHARPRPPTRDVAAADAHATALLDALERHLGG